MAVSTNPVELVKTKLSTGWTPGNTDGVTPSFFSANDPEQQSSFAVGRDVVKLYKGRPRTRARLDNRYDFAKWEANVTVHATSGGTASVTPADHTEKLVSEVERIVNANKTNPDGFWQWMEIDEFDMPEEFRSKSKNLVNVILRRWAAV